MKNSADVFDNGNRPLIEFGGLCPGTSISELNRTYAYPSGHSEMVPTTIYVNDESVYREISRIHCYYSHGKRKDL
jgi:hypothetical protein